MRKTDNPDQIRLMNIEARKRFDAYLVVKGTDGNAAPTTKQARRHWREVQNPLTASLKAAARSIYEIS